MQLIGARLFPSTLDSPATVFTFRVLKEFHSLSLSSKASAYDYYDVLKKHTNAAFPQDVPVSYYTLYHIFINTHKGPLP
jgi:hypothetical protein